MKLKIICLFCPPSLKNFLHLIISSNVSFRLWTFNYYHNLRPFHFTEGRLWGSTAAWLHTRLLWMCINYMGSLFYNSEPGSDSFRLYYFTISPLYYTRSRQRVKYEPVLLAGSNFIHPSVMIQDVYQKLQTEILVE